MTEKITVKKNLLTSLIQPLDHQVLKSKQDEPLGKDHNLWIVIGGVGSGKTTIVINALKHKEFYNKHFDNIYLISPTAKSDDKWGPIVEELEAQNKYYNKCSDQTVQDIMDKITEQNEKFDEAKAKKKNKNRKSGGIRNLIIFDDCIHDLAKGSQQSVQNELFTTLRHKKTSVWITSQKYKALSPLIRNQAKMATFFKPRQSVEKRGILDDLQIPEHLFDFATNQPNGFFHVSLCSGSPVFFSKFDRFAMPTTAENLKD